MPSFSIYFSCFTMWYSFLVPGIFSFFLLPKARFSQCTGLSSTPFTKDVGKPSMVLFYGPMFSSPYFSITCCAACSAPFHISGCTVSAPFSIAADISLNCFSNSLSLRINDDFVEMLTIHSASKSCFNILCVIHYFSS